MVPNTDSPASPRRRQPHQRRGERSPKRSLSVPTELDVLIAAQAKAEGRTYAAVVADRLRDSYEPAEQCAAEATE